MTTRRRRLLAVLGLGFLAVLAGCTAITGSDISEEDLLEDAEYDWERNATASFNVTTSSMLSFSSNRYQAVIEVENHSSLSVHRSSLFRGDRPIDIESLQFRFLNGTVVNASHPGLDADRRSDQTDMMFPANNGTVAFTTTWGGTTTAFGGSPRRWTINTATAGSHEVRMPDGSRTDLPLLSRTSPGGHETSVEDDRATIFWDELDEGDGIVVRYYLARDLWLFGGLFLVGVVAAIGGLTYYYRAIKRARKKREEVGLDVEVDDEAFGDDGPPPGMR